MLKKQRARELENKLLDIQCEISSHIDPTAPDPGWDWVSWLLLNVSRKALCRYAVDGKRDEYLNATHVFQVVLRRIADLERIADKHNSADQIDLTADSETAYIGPDLR